MYTAVMAAARLIERESNPFRPDFGISPVMWAGRNQVLTEFRALMESHRNGASRSTVISGLRGTGKTALLNEMEEIAATQGWVILRTGAQAYAYDKLVDTDIPALLARYEKPHSRISRVSVPGIGAVDLEGQHAAVPKPELEHSLRELLSRVMERGAGVVISMDEAQHFDGDFVHRLATAVQNINRDELPIALLVAGLPAGINALLSLPGTTFLRRARRYLLGPLSPADTRANFADTALTTSVHFDEAGLERITAFSHGYPYLVQLAGWLAWNAAANGSGLIDSHTVEGIEAEAISRLGSQVHSPQLRDVTSAQLEFLEALAAVCDDQQRAPIGAIADTMGRSVKSLSDVRKKLIDAELIIAPSHGVVQFVLPYMADYLNHPSDTITVW